MLKFEPLLPQQRTQYDPILQNAGERGCEYSFTNLCLWGRQRVTRVGDYLAFLSQYNRRNVYPFPVGSGDLKPVLDSIIHDAATRDIPCCLVSLTAADKETLEALYPGQFRFHSDRDSFDYVYAIDTLCELKGKKLQSKRNYVNRFTAAHPNHRLIPITRETIPAAQAMVREWYALRAAEDPHSDYQLERAALAKAFLHWEALALEGMLLECDGEILAMTVGSRLTPDTFDIHFEKALDRADGAYAVINRGFARYLREKYPELCWLNREDDMGIPGLRKAKLSYIPDRLVEKYWACLQEGCCDD